MMSIGVASLERLRSWIKERSGLEAGDYRASFLERRLGPRLQATGCEDADRYLDYVALHPEEGRTFLGKLLVPTTEFFRNPEAFELLGSELLVRFPAPHDRPLSVLCAACSTGEEALSLAILLKELGLPGRIVALDRSLKALRWLRSGRYSLKKVEKIDKELVKRYFTCTEGAAIAKPELLRTIRPLCGDLTAGIPGGTYHVVSVRNLFIYLTPDAQRRILREAERHTAPGGLLLLGQVETLGSRSGTGWRQVASESRIYVRESGK